MTVVVGVHGIAQQQLGRKQLLAAWEPALGDGIEAAAGRPVGDVPFGLAYYGRLFLDDAGPAVRGAKGGPGEDELSDLPADELAELADAAGEAAGEEALRVVDQAAGKGYTRVPAVLQRVCRALDWRYGPGAALLFVGAFRQVRRYLRDDALKASVDGIVDAAVTAGTRVLVGHSLGSVVAFEFVRRRPEHRLDLLVTLGSPLGARFVRALMPDPAHGSAGLPDAVAAWVNVRDPHDPVAFAGSLERYWPGLRDVPVDNQGDAHAAPRYLGKWQTGAALLAVLPELAR
ncbi:hypothetical protein [Streptomyces sp. S.PNR 29]|uniref:alpha/beta fold hydrolase n=1 Tax=Streptomyces sp. S.PNR 29 TaxID=2973805 RepID=UPI0025B17F17|nr:hypothetical protein [Streptomyces sp. S.PNR 29]MDN0193657.1 hypothetical protein [Streptomyces sp. S.PNR 29]